LPCFLLILHYFNRLQMYYITVIKSKNKVYFFLQNRKKYTSLYLLRIITVARDVMMGDACFFTAITPVATLLVWLSYTMYSSALFCVNGTKSPIS